MTHLAAAFAPGRGPGARDRDAPVVHAVDSEAQGALGLRRGVRARDLRRDDAEAPRHRCAELCVHASEWIIDSSSLSNKGQDADEL